MTDTAEQVKIGVDDYLAGEEIAPLKHEYVAGEVFAMAGAGEAHVTVALNLASMLRNHVRGSPCRVYTSDMKVHVEQQTPSTTRMYSLPAILPIAGRNDLRVGSLWITDCFGVRRQSGAAASNLSHGGYQRRLPGIRALKFHPRRGDGAFPWPQHLYIYIAKSKAAAGSCHLADPLLMPSAVGSGQQS